MRSPAPAANSSSVACGARLTIRLAGAASSIAAPVASSATTDPASACVHAVNNAVHARFAMAQRIALVPVAHAGEYARAGGVVIGGKLVMLVERVIEPGEERPARSERVVRSEVECRVATHAACVGGVIKARRGRDQFRTDA